MHPLTAGATVVVIILGLVGIAAFAGWIPSALSQKRAEMTSTAPAPPAVIDQSVRCPGCGVIEAIRVIEIRERASGLGAFAGGAAGALIGNSLGRGNGNTVMTVVGAAGGALAGNEIEKNIKRNHAYRVTVRMNDGSVRSVSQSSPPAFAVGDRVRVINGGVVDGIHDATR